MTAYHVIARTASCGSRRRTALRAATAFTGGILAALAADPNSAFADCIANGTTTVTVDCAANTTTTLTLNSTSTNTPTSDRTQWFDANLVGTIHSGVTIDTSGLALWAAGTTAHTIDMTNSGTVNYSFPVSTDGVINLAGNGGTVTYGGAGAVNGNSFMTAVVLSNTADGNIVFNGTGTLASAKGGLSATTSGIGTITATIANDVTSGVGFGTSAVSTVTANGLNTINMTGGTLVGANGLVASSSGGIRINMTGGQIGLSNNPVGTAGISASDFSTSNDTFITAGGSIHAVAWGINAANYTTNSTGNVRVDVNGGIFIDPTITPTTGTGVSAATYGNGAVTVNVNGAINAPLGESIGVSASGLGSGAVTVNVGANITAGSNVPSMANLPLGTGVLATGTDGLTTVNMTAGTIATGGYGIRAISRGIGGVKVNQTGGQIGSQEVTFGIVAATNGTAGGIDVTSGNITALASGVSAAITNSANNASIAVTANGTLSSGNNAIDVSTKGSGAEQVTVNGTIAAGAIGVSFTGGTNNTLTNSINGSIATSGGISGLAVAASGNLAISNAGLITGNVELIGNNNSFSNETTGTYAAGFTVLVGGTLTNKGNFAPGGVGAVWTTTLTGNFVQTASGKYLVDVTPTTADKTVVTGSATLGGSVQATFATGSYIANTYKIMSASSFSGTFSNLSTVNLPTGMSAKLAYTATDVELLLSLGLANNSNTNTSVGSGQPSQFVGFNLNQNQNNVATSIDNFFNTVGVLNAAFTNLVNLPAGSIPAALSGLTGEIGTGAATASSQAMGQFLDTMLDPFIDGRDNTSMGGSAMAYAPELAPPMDVVAAAVPSLTKAPPAESFERRWSAWGSAFGGLGRFAGNSNVGSNDLSARTGGLAAGLDRRLGPDTVLGVALAGHSLSYDLAAGMGAGHGDGVQVGLYGSQRFGIAYLSGAASYAWEDLSTDRNVMVGGLNDHLTAKFNAQGVGGRLEGGMRFALTDYFGITPYAAGQVQALRTPAYSETDATGLNAFALSYTAKTTTDPRSELGARFDSRFWASDRSMLILRARGAWAHDFSTSPSANATFQTLPGFGFTVFGAAPERDTALASVAAEYRLMNGVSFLAKFDGQFGDTTHVYAGTGAVRVAW